MNYQPANIYTIKELTQLIYLGSKQSINSKPIFALLDYLGFNYYLLKDSKSYQRIYSNNQLQIIKNFDNLFLRELI